MDTPALKDGSGKDFHDTMQQHLRALKTKSEPDPSFVTSILELKLDEMTLFEWQKHSQEKVEEVPHYQEILDFIDLWAQALESLADPSRKQNSTSGKIASFAAANCEFGGRSHCVVCTSERHPLYACQKFKAMFHNEKLSTLRKNNLCLNCLGSGHFAKQCRSSHQCKKCQRSHHTLLHIEVQGDAGSASPQPPHPSEPSPTQIVSSAAMKVRSSSLLMTCRVLIFASDGSTIEARALLDNGSTSSFVSERLVQSLRLPHSQCSVCVSGIAGSLVSSALQSIANFKISSTHSNGRKIDLTAVVLPRVTCDLPVTSVPFDLYWTHLSGLPLADPGFGEPQHIDLLLGVDIFVDVLCHGRRTGPTGAPVAMETEFGWVVCGGSTASSDDINLHAALHHASAVGNDDILCKFWEIEESPANSPILTLEERSVFQHFDTNHFQTKGGRFVVPLPRRPDARPIGESRSQAVCRFLALEGSLHRKDKFHEVDAVVQEYLTLGHAEIVLIEDTDKDPSAVFYLPMHVMYKDSSTTTKVRAVFDASAKSASGVSLKDTLLVGPTVHPPLLDVLLRFRMHCVALTTDVSKMYRAVELVPSD